MAHLTREILEQRFAELPPVPKNEGEVVLVVARPETNERLTPQRVRLTVDGGVDGDRWAKRESPSPRNQITVIRADVAELVADGQPVALCGDNLQVRLDVSSSNLPAGTRLRVGTALCEVTPQPLPGAGSSRRGSGRRRGRGRTARSTESTGSAASTSACWSRAR